MRRLIPTLQSLDCMAQFFVAWYALHGRFFPWRREDSPPHGVLLVELLLRQTKAEQVVPVWTTLMVEYSSLEDLATASKVDLEFILRPLGLQRQRANAIQECFRDVSSRWGAVPDDIDELVSVPHVGLYAAHAVASFAFGKRVPVVDSNILRVLGRLTGIDLGKDNRRSPDAWRLAYSILPESHVREHNFGLLDFSAQICTPRTPVHEICPLQSICVTAMSAERND